MMSTAAEFLPAVRSTALTPQEIKWEKQKLVIETAKAAASKGLDTAKDISLGLLASPYIQVIAANVLVELLQRVELNKVPEAWEVKNGQRVRVKTRLVSDQLGTTLQSLINTEAVLSALMGSGGGILPALLKFLK